MQQPGQHTYREIVSQPEAWIEAIATGRRIAAAVSDLCASRSGRASELVFTGCGSTYYLGVAAAALAQEVGLRARAVPASEIWLSRAGPRELLADTVLVALSRSGETTETLRAVDVYRQAGGHAVILATCAPGSPLAMKADLVLAVPGAQEQSMAQTRSFSSMLILCQFIVAAAAEEMTLVARLDEVPAAGRRLIAKYEPIVAGLGSDGNLRRFYYLGNGPCYGLAQEAMLKMKEMSISDSEAYHVLEFRHGPMSMVDGSALVVGLLSDENRAIESAVMADMHRLGARTLAVIDRDDGAHSDGRGEVICLESGLRPVERLALCMPLLQLLAFYRAMQNKVNPDSPRNLRAVIAL